MPSTVTALLLSLVAATVRLFDQEAVDVIEKSKSLAFVRFDPVSSKRCNGESAASTLLTSF